MKYKNGNTLKATPELTDEELKAYKFLNQHKTRISEKKPTAEILSFEHIPREDIQWLWKNRIALGKLTILAGDPGVSKSLVSVDLAARLSTGFPFPDRSDGFTGNTIFLTMEDDPGDTIRPRLEAAHAELSRCHIIKSKILRDDQGIEKKGLFMIQDLDVLRDALNQIKAKGGNPLLLVIDPIDSFQGHIDSNSNEVREMLTPLVEFAAQEQIAILIIKHLNKNSNGPASYRVTGHIGYTAVVRSAWVVVKDPDDQEKKLFLCLKNNIGKDNSGLSYTIKEDSSGVPFLEWDQNPEYRSLDEVMSRRKDNRKGSDKQNKIMLFLLQKGEARTSEIAQTIGSSESSTSNMLRKMCSSGLVEKTEYGSYCPVGVEKKKKKDQKTPSLSSVSSPPKSDESESTDKSQKKGEEIESNKHELF